VGRDDGARAGEYAAIVFDPSRLAVRESGTFWFSSTPEVAGTADWGNVNVRICTWGQFEDQASGLGFVLFNVHLDHESAPSRMKSAELLVERIRQESAGFPTIVTGDFNADEQDPCIQILRDAGFRDSYRVLHPDVSDVGTFHGFSGAYMPEKIDYIWVDPAWSVRDAEVVRSLIDGGTPSDHAPVTATLEFCEAKMME
jgi:endonuclease/exonuclease/phosphatase family metal-dependent hydrolase